MSDEHLRDLERRWRASGDAADRRRYLEAQARAGDSWARFKLDAEDHDPEACERALQAIAEERLKAIGPGTDLRSWMEATRARAREFVKGWPFLANPEQLGGPLHHSQRWPWAGSYEPRVPLKPGQIVGWFVGGAHDQRRALLRTLAFAEDVVREANGEVDRATAVEVANRIIDQTIAATDCDDAWYGVAETDLSFLARELGLPVEQAELVSLAVRASFQSWSEPTADERASVTDMLVGLLDSPRSDGEALLPHMATSAEMAWHDPPSVVAELLQRVDAVPFRETGAQEAFLDAHDLPAHPGETDRRARFLDGLIAVRRLADSDQAPRWSELRSVQSVLLGTDQHFRQGEAGAPGGRRYLWLPTLGRIFAEKLWEDAYSGVHPLLKAVRLYQDVIFFHPFADGNARAARLWLEFWLRRGKIPTPDLAPLMRLEKIPGDSSRTWAFAMLLAKRVLAEA